MTVAVLVILLAVLAASCGVAGVFLLLGLAWALIAAAAALALFAVVLRMGMTPNG